MVQNKKINNFRKISISQTLQNALQHGKKNSQKHFIQSETRNKKPEVWNLLLKFFVSNVHVIVKQSYM